MRKELLIITSMLFSLGIGDGQANCIKEPNCAEMGYTKTEAECEYGSLKCPWNTGLVYCKKRRAKCQIGWIYYNDETCSANVISGKTALGVVVYINPDGVGGQVMSAWPIDENGNKSNSESIVYWSTQDVNIPSLPDYTSDLSATQDFDSCGNTNTLSANSDRTFYLAVQAARLYVANETTGKWCLPAAGIMTSIYNNQSAVQAGIKKLGGIEFPDCCTWSSSENDNNRAWISNFSETNGLFAINKNDYHYVRPVMEF